MRVWRRRRGLCAESARRSSRDMIQLAARRTGCWLDVQARMLRVGVADELGYGLQASAPKHASHRAHVVECVVEDERRLLARLGSRARGQLGDQIGGLARGQQRADDPESGPWACPLRSVSVELARQPGNALAPRPMNAYVLLREACCRSTREARMAYAREERRKCRVPSEPRNLARRIVKRTTIHGE